MQGSPSPPRLPFSRVLVGLLVLALLVIGVRALVGPGDRDEASGASAPPPPATLAATPLPSCRGPELGADRAGYGQWAQTLVDTRFSLPRDYVPPDLVSVGEAGFGGAFRVRGLVIDDLGALRRAAAAAGHPLGIAAAYRSWTEQQALFAGHAQTEGGGVARAKVARPGHSEHQLGTTVDFRSADAPDVDASWGNTPAGRWLAANAWRFGFVMSYPRGETADTCYWYEPWHFRYVGREEARSVHDSGEPLREYLWDLLRPAP